MEENVIAQDRRGIRSQPQGSAPLRNIFAEESDGSRTTEVSLARADGGMDAWLFLGGCSLMIGITWASVDFIYWEGKKLILAGFTVFLRSI
jgi:hypothetical protein